MRRSLYADEELLHCRAKMNGVRVLKDLRASPEMRANGAGSAVPER